MIPSVIPRDCPSAGEIEVFNRLRDDPRTADWIVLHSLSLAAHDERVTGEIDFVVLIPERGVLCIEVKGCSAANLRRDGGLWFYGPSDRGDARGPFKQASQAMHSLRRQVLDRFTSFRGIQFSSGVIFPFAPFREQSPEWKEWEYVDSRKLRSAPISRLLERLMDAARVDLLAAPTRPSLTDGAPTVEQCRAIVDELRGNFEVTIDRRARQQVLAAELQRFTAEQYVALDAMAENPRTIFVGPAGTGKTFLALEAARRARDDGRRALLLCYNRLLGRWLRTQAADLAPDVVTRTLQAQMLAVSGLDVPTNPGQKFWDEELPERAIDRLLERRDDDVSDWLFDELIIDEAQDLLTGPFLDFLDLSLRGGLSSGRWRMFGDFEGQSIYGTDVSLEQLRVERATAPLYKLRVNCRNTPRVAEYVHLLAGLDPRYGAIRRPDDGIRPLLRFYADEDDQNRQLIATLNELDGLGFHGEEITVLSPRGEARCAAARVGESPWRERLRSFVAPGMGHPRFGTIHAFKGLEAAAIVVTDIEEVEGDEARALFYIGITRSVQRLVVLAHERVRGQIERMVFGAATAD